MKFVSVLLFMAVFSLPALTQPLAINQWQYIQVDDNRGKWGDTDEPKFLRYFGVDMGDANGDGLLDIVSGRYFYRNPGRGMTGKWQRIDFGRNVDALHILNIDDDEYADVIAQALPGIYWLEAKDKDGNEWLATKVGSAEGTDHVNSQGFRLAQIVSGGKPEFIIAAGDGIYYFEIPSNPSDEWKKIRIASGTSSEGIGVGDIDGDGKIDICHSKANEYTAWWKNPGNGSADWQRYIIGKTEHDGDRLEIADINGDKRADIIVSEERYPGPDPDAYLFWFEQPVDPSSGEWKRHTIVTEYSLNNLDVADMDNDGDIDVVTCEHKGPHLRLQVFENDGKGAFTRHDIDQGKESHLGTQLADMDGDGDLDIVSIAWDNHKFLHLWRNDAVKK